MTLWLLPFVFFIGAVIGSFINVLVIRSLTGEQFLWGRSHCDSCRRDLEWFELIPLVSFFALRGRCRTCHTPIDIMHPVVELLTASLFAWWFVIGFAFFQLTTQPLMIIQPGFWLLVGLLLLVIFLTDIQAYYIPDWATLMLSLMTLAYRFVLIGFGIYNPQSLAWALFGAALILFFFLFLWLITGGRGMGFGDVKLVFALGLLMEWPAMLVGIFLAFVYGAIVGVGVLIVSRQRRGVPIPFAPFLILGTATALMWGDSLLRWYMQFL
ncbi:prepilin peptidase [Candidatus Woesebacteria bacterium]|nr:prepilin peptidase [Candidatus Woesebacteria bacterium]MCD8526620.1 prepilin peptidase [Candidatus Woesebacteria bacterium]MCD8546016.1 prepilin peptidase [Candidatus Woesebacteria bacterium]